MATTIELRHCDGATYKLPAATLAHVSPLLRDIIGTVDASNASHMINEDCTADQLEAFVQMCTLTMGEEHENKLSIATFCESPGNVMVKALPLIHKYQADGLKELCKTMINNQVQKHNLGHCGVFDSILEYDKLYGEPWPDATLKYIIICKVTGQGDKAKQHIDREPLLEFCPSTLVDLLAIIKSNDERHGTQLLKRAKWCIN